MRTAYFAALFFGDPLTIAVGLLMFRYPQAWAKMNAHLSSKERSLFDTPEQLASTKRLGMLLVLFAAFSFVSMLAMRSFIFKYL